MGAAAAANKEEEVVVATRTMVVVGSGVYRIGSSVEFDHSTISCLRALREAGWRTVVVNHNPETVSTDYDESDQLYFEELSEERVLDIMEIEGASDIMISFGGQAGQNLVPRLHGRSGVRIWGTPTGSIIEAENRAAHSAMLDTLNIDQPTWASSSDVADLHAFGDDVGFPVLVRPSFVLAGTAMRVVSSHEELDRVVERAAAVSEEFPVVVSKFIMDGTEVDVDAVAEQGQLLHVALSEHVERVGVHSGDATMVSPPYSLGDAQIYECVDIASRIARHLSITGPFNLQIIMSPDGRKRVIETNVRASRSMPFVSTVQGVNFAAEATRAMLRAGSGFDAAPQAIPDLWKRAAAPAAEEISTTDDRKHIQMYGVKASVFSFDRLPGASYIRRVSMKATGEVACLSRSYHEALLCSLDAANRPFPLPPRARPDVPSHGDHSGFKVCVLLRGASGDLNSNPSETGTLPLRLVNVLRDVVDVGWLPYACNFVPTSEQTRDVHIHLDTDRVDSPLHVHNASHVRLLNRDFEMVLDFCAVDGVCEESQAPSDQLRSLAVSMRVPIFTEIELVAAALAALQPDLLPDEAGDTTIAKDFTEL